MIDTQLKCTFTAMLITGCCAKYKTHTQTHTNIYSLLNTNTQTVTHSPKPQCGYKFSPAVTLKTNSQ